MAKRRQNECDIRARFLREEQNRRLDVIGFMIANGMLCMYCSLCFVVVVIMEYKFCWFRAMKSQFCEETAIHFRKYSTRLGRFLIPQVCVIHVENGSTEVVTLVGQSCKIDAWRFSVGYS